MQEHAGEGRKKESRAETKAQGCHFLLPQRLARRQQRPDRCDAQVSERPGMGERGLLGSLTLAPDRVLLSTVVLAEEMKAPKVATQAAGPAELVGLVLSFSVLLLRSISAGCENLMRSHTLVVGWPENPRTPCHLGRLYWCWENDTGTGACQRGA